MVDYCRRKQFEWNDIAAIIDVHRDTLLNWRKVHYPDVDDPIYPLTEDELSNVALDELVKAAIDAKEAWGEQRVWSLLMSRGTRITRARLRDSLKRVDPEGVEKRRLKKGKVRAHLDIYEAFEVV